MKTKRAQTGVYLPVIFRRNSGVQGDVFALFPTEPASPDGSLCMCYQHVGQHSQANVGVAVQHSMLADLKDSDVMDLWAELIRIGYSNLKPFKRNQARFDRRRHAAAAKV